MGHPRTLSTEHQEQRQLVRPMQSDPVSLSAGHRGLHNPLSPGDQHPGGEYHQRGVSSGGEHHPEGSTTCRGAPPAGKHTSVCSENQEVQRLEHMHLLHRQSPVKHWHCREVTWKRKPGYQHSNPRHFPEPSEHACGCSGGQISLGKEGGQLPALP